METAQIHISRALRNRLKIKAAKECRTLLEVANDIISKGLSMKVTNINI